MAPSGGKKGKEVDQSPASILRHGDYTVSLTSWLAGGPAVIGKKPRRVLDMKIERDRKSEKSDRSLVLASSKKSDTAASDMEVTTSRSDSLTHTSRQRQQTESSSSQRIVSSRPFLTYEEERVEKFTIRPPPVVFNNPEDVPTGWLETILNQRKYGESSKAAPKRAIGYEHSESDDDEAGYLSPPSKSKSLSKKSSSSSRKPSKIRIETKSSSKKGTRRVEVTTTDASDESDELSSDAESRRLAKTKKLEHRSKIKERRKMKIHVDSSDEETADDATADSEWSDIESATIKLRSKPTSKKKPIASSKKSGSAKVKIETRDKKGKRKVVVEASSEEEVSSDESMSEVKLSPLRKSKSKNRVTVTEATRKGTKKIVTVEPSDEGETTHIKSRSSIKGKKSEVHIKAGRKSKTKKVTFETTDEAEITEDATTDAEPVPAKAHKGKDKTKAKAADKGKTKAKKKVEVESSEAVETTDAVTTEAETNEAKTTEAATTEVETTDAEVTVPEKLKATPESDEGWTPSQDAILLGMKEGGESWASIAKATGQNKKSVIKRHQELVKSGVAQVKKGNQNRNNKKEQKANNKESQSNDASSSQPPAAEETFGFGDLPGFGGNEEGNNNDNNGGDAWGAGDQNNNNNNTDNSNNGGGGDGAWGNGDQNNNGFDSGFAPSWGADCTGGEDQDATNNNDKNNGLGDAGWGSGDQDNIGGGNVGPGFGDGWAADCTGGNSKPPSNAGSKNGSNSGNRPPSNKPSSNKPFSNSGNNGWGEGSNPGKKPPSNNGSRNTGGSNHGSNNNRPPSNNGGGSNRSNKPPSNNGQGGGYNQGNGPPSNSGNNGWGGGSNQGSNNNRPSSNNGNGWNNSGSNQGNRPPSNRSPSKNGGFSSGSNQGHSNNNNSKPPSNNGGQGSGSNNGNRPPSNNGDWGGVGPTQNNNSGWDSGSNHGNRAPSNSGNANNGGSNLATNRPPSNNGNWGSGSNHGNNSNNNARPLSNNSLSGGSNQGNSNRLPSNNGDWGNSGPAQSNNAGWASGSNQGNNNYNKPPSNAGSARGLNHGRPPSNNGGRGWDSGSNSGNRPPSNNGDWSGDSNNQGNRPLRNNGRGSGSNPDNNKETWGSGLNHGRPPSNSGGWGSGSNNGHKSPSNNGSNRGSGFQQGNPKEKDECEKDQEIRALKERVSEEKLHRLEAEVFALKLQQGSANRLNQNKGSENGGMGWNTGGSDKNWKAPPSVAGSVRSNNQPDGWKSRPASGEVWGVAQNPDYKPASNSGWVPNEIVPPQNTKPPSNKPPSNNNNNNSPGSPDGWIYGSPTESEKQRVVEKVESWKGSISPPKEEGRWGTPDGGWPADQAENAPDRPRGRSPTARSSASAKNCKQRLTRIEEEPAGNGYEMWKKPSGNNNGKSGGNADRKSSGKYNNKKPSGEQYGWNFGHDIAAETIPPRGSQISTPEFKPVEANEWTKGTRNDKPPRNRPPSKDGDWTPGIGATAGWMADCTKAPSNSGWVGGSNYDKDNNKPPSNAGSTRDLNNGKSPNDNGGWTYAPITRDSRQNNKAPSLTGFKPEWGMDCTGPWDGKLPANNKPSKKDDHKNALNIHTVTDLPDYNGDVDIAPIGLSGFPPGMDHHIPAPVPVPPITPYSDLPGRYPATPYSSKGTKTPHPPGYVSDKTSAHSTILPLYNKHTPFYDATPPTPAPGPSYQVGQRSSHFHPPPLSEQDLESLYKQVVFGAISSGQPLLQPKPDHVFSLRDCWALIALSDQYDRSSASKKKWFDLQAKFASATGGKEVEAIVLRAKVRQAEKKAKKVEGWEDEEVGWRYKAWRDREREREREREKERV